MMEDIKIGNIVEVLIEEGHVLFYYNLKVTSIEEGDEGEIIAYGEGITEDDKACAEEFTCRIDSQNFNRIVC